MAALMLAHALASAVLLLAGTAAAWTEDQVIADEVRITVERSGAAVVEHRLSVKLNGNERRRSYLVHGVDADAEPLPNAYVVPAREALGSSLAEAMPLALSLVRPESRPPEDAARPAPLAPSSAEPGDAETALRLYIDDDKGILRGAFVFVFRYRTDLRARGMLRRDGTTVLIDWRGPLFDSGLTARTLFALPVAPSAPRTADAATPDDPSAFISEVRRASDGDEIELLRSYVSRHERIVWSIRTDRRAFESMLQPAPAPLLTVPPAPPPTVIATRPTEIAAAASLFCAFALLAACKGRQARRLARAAGARVLACVPLPELVRVPLAAASLTGGVGLQLLAEQTTWGALLVVAAALCAAHGSPRMDSVAERSTSLRGPGRWLAMSEREALVPPPRPRGATLDIATRAGKFLALLCCAPFALLAVWLWPRTPYHAVLILLDSVAVCAVFGTGGMRALPPDMAVEPIRFFRKLARAIRRCCGGESLRLVPRVRVPNGEIDPDELRLLVVPRLPKRGFVAIEVGVTYAIGLGARVAMPEVLLRVVAGSPCDEAIASLTRNARITPGRKPAERVLAFSPRFPTARMSAEIAVALAARVAGAAAAQ